jgi:hypothetical protein
MLELHVVQRAKTSRPSAGSTWSHWSMFGMGDRTTARLRPGRQVYIIFFSAGSNPEVGRPGRTAPGEQLDGDADPRAAALSRALVCWHVQHTTDFKAA